MDESRGRSSVDPRRWSTKGSWVEEAREEALARAPEFGRRFFAALFERFPSVAPAAVFLRWSTQADDVYAVVGLPAGGFGIQIDPDLEYIVVWIAGDQAEFGDWDGDQVEPALAFVAEILAAADGGDGGDASGGARTG